VKEQVSRIPSKFYEFRSFAISNFSPFSVSLTNPSLINRFTSKLRSSAE
jgi:hypothetical protein